MSNRSNLGDYLLFLLYVTYLYFVFSWMHITMISYETALVIRIIFLIMCAFLFLLWRLGAPSYAFVLTLLTGHLLANGADLDYERFVLALKIDLSYVATVVLWYLCPIFLVLWIRARLRKAST